MKNIKIIIMLWICSLSATAQKVGEQAILPECAKEKLPGKCTEDKIQADIIGFITPQMLTDAQKAGTLHFPVSLFFVSDEAGKVVQDEIKVACPDTGLANTIKTYLQNLPHFLPKSAKMAERRSAQLINFIVVKNSHDDNFHIASYLETKDLKLPAIHPDSLPVYPGCEKSETKKESLQCLQQSILAKIYKNYTMPKNVSGPGTDKMNIVLLVSTDGRVSVEEIEGSSKPFQDEVFSAVKMIPKLQPAMKKGIPVPMRFYLPMKLTVN